MAIKKDYEANFPAYAITAWGKEESTPVTVVFKDAYIKVLSTAGGKDCQNVSVQISSGEKQFIKGYEFCPDMDGPNFIKQAYLYLKTLPEFEGAEDV